MANVISVTNFNDSEYKEIKKSAKAMLKNVPFSISRNRQQYALNTISIKPTKKTNYHWSVEQVEQVLNFVKSQGLWHEGLDEYSKHTGNMLKAMYGGGFHFMWQKA